MHPNVITLCIKVKNKIMFIKSRDHKQKKVQSSKENCFNTKSQNVYCHNG